MTQCIFCKEQSETRVCPQCNLTVIEASVIGVVALMALFALIVLFLSMEDPFQWWRYGVVMR